ncbi:MAG TPA: glycine cleavage system protein GcvH [Steroidobacteraceae bacterium]|nr:glycine cleavage system protein GcvH [Steroidobacteraceae bacterium]
MSNIPSDLRYTKSHEWVRREHGDAPNGTVTIGISDHAQSALGDLVFVEVPDVGRAVSAGEACAVVESVKAASDVYSPVSGKVIAGNAALAAQPELLNQDPYGAGWLFRVQTSSPADEAALMSAADYANYLADEAK